jgi:hypothetical protein
MILGVKNAVIISPAMAVDGDEQFIKQTMAPLCGPVHRSLERAVGITAEHLESFGMTLEDYGPVYRHLARGHAIHQLCQVENELKAWRVARRRPNSQFSLSSGAMKLRLLRPSYDGGPPAAGTNKARINYFRNPDATLFGAAASNLLGVWYVDPVTAEISILVTRPTGVGDRGINPKVDIAFWLPDSADELESLEFVPEDDELTLPIELDPDPEEEGDADSADG